MKITEIKYRLQRNTRTGSDIVEATVEISDQDDPQAAFTGAREVCAQALANGRDVSLTDRLRVCMNTEHGRAALENFLANLPK